MNNPIANLFLALQAKIESLTDNDSNPLIRYINQDFGQLETEQPRVSWPCALIDIDDLQFESMANNCQSGKGNVIIRIGFTPYSSTSNITPEEYKEKALGFFELENSLHQALQGWCPIPDDDIFGKFNRISARTEKRDDRLRIREVIYSIGFDDYSTSTVRTTSTKPTPNISDD